MNRLLFLALLACTFSGIFAYNQNASNVNVAANFATIDTMKIAAFQPLVTKYVRDIPIPENVTTKIGSVNLFISNIILLGVDMDWPSSKLLTAENTNGHPTVLLKDLFVQVQFDCKVKFGLINSFGANNTVNITLDVDIEAAFENLNDLFYAYIAKQDVAVKKMSINYNGALHKIANLIEKALGSQVNKAVAGVIHDKIIEANKTIVEKTSQPVIVNITTPIDIHGSIVNFPQILETTWAGTKRLVQTANLDIEAYKDGQKYDPNGKLIIMPNLLENFAPLQAIVSQRVFQIAVWTAFQTSLTDHIFAIIADDIVPAESPIHLITTNLTDLAPNLVKDFGADKGVYLKVSKGGLYPIFTISEGKIDAALSVLVDVFVDTDSKNYPKQGFENCTTCRKAASLNITGYGSVNAFKVAPLLIGGQILEATFKDIQVLSGNVDGERIKNGLNNLAKPLIEQVNKELKKGVQIPDIVKKYGLNDTNIKIDGEHLVVGGDFTIPNKMQVLEY